MDKDGRDKIYTGVIRDNRRYLLFSWDEVTAERIEETEEYLQICRSLAVEVRDEPFSEEDIEFLQRKERVIKKLLRWGLDSNGVMPFGLLNSLNGELQDFRNIILKRICTHK